MHSALLGEGHNCINVMLPMPVYWRYFDSSNDDDGMKNLYPSHGYRWLINIKATVEK